MSSRSGTGPASPSEPDGLPTPQRYWSMLAIAVGITMSVLDAAVANIALPTIARQLHAAPAEAVWVINAYQLAVVVALLPLAAWGERVGYRRVYQGGLALFTAGSLACALSHTLPLLAVARAFQGFGAAGIMSVNGALVRFTYPRALLGRGVGLNALVVSVAAALGPTLASAILSVATWEWLFAVNVPIGIVNLVLAARALPHNDLSSRPLDWISAGLNALVFGGFFIGADVFSHRQGTGWMAFGVAATAFAAGVILVRREAREAQPLIPLDLLKTPVFGLSVVASVCSFAAYMLAFVSLPFFFESVLHRDQVQTGLLMTPWPVAVGVTASIAGRLSDRFSPAVLGAVGLMVLAAGLAALMTLSSHATTADIIWRMALCGLGFGCFQSPNNRTMLSAAPSQRAGAAGGMLATARLTGMTSGATLAALVFRAVPQRAEPVSLCMGAVLAVAAAVASVLRRSHQPAG